jgi:hypothetical protein
MFPANAIGLGAGIAAGVYYGYTAKDALVAGTTTAGVPPYYTAMNWIVLLGLLLLAIFFGLIRS